MKRGHKTKHTFVLQPGSPTHGPGGPRTAGFPPYLLTGSQVSRQSGKSVSLIVQLITWEKRKPGLDLDSRARFDEEITGAYLGIFTGSGAVLHYTRGLYSWSWKATGSAGFCFPLKNSNRFRLEKPDAVSQLCNQLLSLIN